MTNSDYQRGYQRGQASMSATIERYRKAVEEANERARNAEAGTFGPCQKCVRWTRGTPGHPHWGYCEFPKVIDVANTQWWGEPGHRVYTQENFGCIRFQQTPGA